MTDPRLFFALVCSDLDKHPDSCGCNDGPRLPPKIPVDRAPVGQGGSHLPDDLTAVMPGGAEQRSEVLEQMRDVQTSVKREVGAMRPTNAAKFNKKQNRG